MHIVGILIIGLWVLVMIVVFGLNRITNLYHSWYGNMMKKKIHKYWDGE